jgi:hypothetical protein
MDFEKLISNFIESFDLDFFIYNSSKNFKNHVACAESISFHSGTISL